MVKRDGIDTLRHRCYTDTRYIETHKYLKEADVMAREQLQTLSEPMYFILLALTRPMHGYEIMQTVSAVSHGRVKVGAGTLYALLTRFEKEKIVIRVSDDGRRKTYALTEKGRGFLDREYERLKESITAYEAYLREVESK
jgi:DNA-binding PadR family transcriptional regulator